MRTKLTALWVVCLIALAGFSVYTALWHWGAQKIHEQIGLIYLSAANHDITIESDFGGPSVGGFPGKHHIHFSGRIGDGRRRIDIARLDIQGFFLPGQRVKISLPQGFSLHDAWHMQDGALWSADRLDIEAVIPSPLPRTITQADMRVWHDAGGTLDITRIALRKDELTGEGHGNLHLDQDLQPAGTMNMRISGFIPFVARLRDQDYISQRDAMVAGTILSGLSQPDPETNVRYVDLPLILQNRTIFAGPLRLGMLDLVVWDGADAP